MDTFDTLLSKAEIPIIDLGLVGGENEWNEPGGGLRVAAQLHRSLEERGLALLVNHGVPEDKLRAGFEAMHRFCDLPQDVRDWYRRVPPNQHGYVAPGTERLSEEWIGEIRHTFNVSSKSGRLPESEVPGFQETVTQLGTEFLRLSRLLLQVMAVGLEMPADFFLEHHQGMLTDVASNPSSLRLEFYPPFVAPAPAGVTRCGEHTDCGTLSIWAQDTEGGLEVHTGSHWERVGHLPGALLINTGDALSAWTCNRYASTMHRVIVPDQPKVRARGRHVVGFLVHPDNDALIKPIERLAVGSNPVPAQIRADLLIDSSRRRKRSFYAPHHNLSSRFRETAAS